MRRRRAGVAFLLILFAACGATAGGPADAIDAAVEAGTSDAAVETDTSPYPGLCSPDDPDPRGPVCSRNVASDAQFDGLSIGPTGVQHWARATKYMVPVRDDPTLIPALVQNANRYPVHMEFLASVLMPGLDLATYTALVNLRATRQYYAGNLVRIEDPVQGTLYGFTAYAANRQAEILEPSEVRWIREQLGAVVTAGPLAYTFEPFDAMGPAKAQAWIDPGFPVWFPAQQYVTTEVYTPGTAYGRVRRFTIEAFEPAAGLVGWRDIVVLDTVPFDIESVVAALVTGGRQWELGHVSVRLARRGTPNLYVRDALDELAAWDGRLVRLEAANGSGATNDTWSVTEVPQAEAEAWWAAHRPGAPTVPVADREYGSLDTLTSMDVDDTPVPLVSRFGGKAANLARLYALLDPAYQVPGFGIPFAPFEAFLDSTYLTDPRVSPPDEVTLREYVRRLASDPAVAADAAYRKALLADLRDGIETGGVIPPALVEAVATRIGGVFGGTGVRVRFRSSGNVEDDLVFSAAGLYDSTTVCADDSLDGDGVGPSACDGTEGNERSIERGLRRVWASLYNDRAWDERDWYQVPQEDASMAILVTLGFPDEQANGVAFTGDPSDPSDARYLVNAQVGDEKVVTNDPSKVPEADRLEITDGQVTHIDRVRSSTLATPGVPVMNDALLKELGALMAEIDAAYPLDLAGHARSEVLLDIEFKVQKGTSQLKLKQIRPFLRNLQPR